jgi:hypothetical protein
MSTAQCENPFIVQSDHTVLVEVDRPRYIEGRDALARFASRVKRYLDISRLAKTFSVDLQRHMRASRI